MAYQGATRARRFFQTTNTSAPSQLVQNTRCNEHFLKRVRENDAIKSPLPARELQRWCVNGWDGLWSVLRQKIQVCVRIWLPMTSPTQRLWWTPRKNKKRVKNVFSLRKLQRCCCRGTRRRRRARRRTWSAFRRGALSGLRSFAFQLLGFPAPLLSSSLLLAYFTRAKRGRCWDWAKTQIADRPPTLPFAPTLGVLKNVCKTSSDRSWRTIFTIVFVLNFDSSRIVSVFTWVWASKFKSRFTKTKKRLRTTGQICEMIDDFSIFHRPWNWRDGFGSCQHSAHGLQKSHSIKKWNYEGLETRWTTHILMVIFMQEMVLIQPKTGLTAEGLLNVSSNFMRESPSCKIKSSKKVIWKF